MEAIVAQFATNRSHQKLERRSKMLDQQIKDILLPEGGKIEYSVNNDDFQIIISEMYEYLPMNLGMLVKLSELLGTQDIRTEQESWGGCETCDYGSKYMHQLYIKNVTKNKDKLTKLCKKG